MYSQISIRPSPQIEVWPGDETTLDAVTKMLLGQTVTDVVSCPLPNTCTVYYYKVTH